MYWHAECVGLVRSDRSVAATQQANHVFTARQKRGGENAPDWASLVTPMTQQNSLAASDSTKATILLVDDEQSVRSIVLKILRRASYNVLEAENGGAALKLAESYPGPIDLVITDMYMPGLRGPEVAARLAATRPGLRVLFMSGYADQDARTGVPEGANFLNKPFSGSDLAKTVEAVLNGPSVS